MSANPSPPAGPRLTAEDLIEAVANWSRLEAGIAAVVLVGSHARGEARPDSDIDLVLLCADPQVYLKDQHWVRRFGQPAAIQQEAWGNVTSLRVWVAGCEVEFGLTSVDWAADPQDRGAAEVVHHGARILVDRDGMLAGRIRRVLARSSAEGTQPEAAFTAVSPDPIEWRVAGYAGDVGVDRTGDLDLMMEKVARFLADDIRKVRAVLLELRPPIQAVALGGSGQSAGHRLRSPEAVQALRTRPQREPIPHDRTPGALGTLSLGDDAAGGSFTAFLGEVVAQVGARPEGRLLGSIPIGAYEIFPIRLRHKLG